VTGCVDSEDRALLVIGLRPGKRAKPVDVTIWIDTAFTGDLVLPRLQIASFGLPVKMAVPAVLADGTEIEVDTYSAYLDWFGPARRIQVIANDGRFPLLGMGLLRDRVLHIDYASGTLTLD
jgi:predicted aspartyl protease